MEEYKSYDEYKESGIEWLGYVPKKWNLVKFKYLFSYQKGNSPNKYTNKNNGVPYLSMDYLRDNEEEIMYVKNDSNMAEIKPNQILLLWDGSNSGEFIKSKYGLLSSTMAVINSLELNKEFSYYWFKSSEKYIKDQTIGMGIPHVDSKILKNLYITVPSKKEQQKIALFLDQKKAKIDKIINKKENLIEKLKEYKKSVITEAVTKGKLEDKYINEDGELVDEIEMKDSGVEWIGKMPTFINSVKIKRLTQIKRGASPRPIDNPVYFDENGEYSWVRISDVTSSDDYLLETEQTLSELGASKSVKMDKGDIFLSIAATIGKPIITKIKCCIHDGFVYFPEYKGNKKYLFYIFKSEQPYKGLGKHGTQINLNTTIVGNIKIPYFSHENQKRISKYLDCKTKQINKLIQRTKESIEKYTEYKKSLIFEAVTGKIDLRDYEVKEGEDSVKYDNTRKVEGESLSRVN